MDPADTEANPGDVLRYLLTLTNGGADDALDVAYSGLLDASATLVAGSLRVSPLAAPDPYTGAVAASAYTVAAAAGLRANDAPGLPVATVASFGGGTLGGTEATNAAGTTATFGTGGQITVAADGSFVLTAPAGFSGTLTFRYRLANSAGADAAEVSVAVAVVPTQLTLTTQPSATAQSGAAFAVQPAVQLRDAAGNAVARAGVVVTAAIATGGGTLGGTATATTDASGLATFAGLSVSGTAGSRTLTFSSPDLTSVTSGAVAVTPGVAASLEVAAPPSVLTGTAATVTVTLRDAAGNVAVGYRGTVRLTSTDGAATLPADATFTATDAGTRAVSVTLRTAGNQSVTATDTATPALTATAGVAVTAAPTAVADAPASGSAPGSAYHTAFDTPLAVAAPGVLGNDSRGFPAATVTSFGGGALGGSVTTNAAGATAAVGAGGQVSVAADGSIAFTPPTGATGLFTFSYRITNSVGTSDATITLAVGVRPAVAADAYPSGLVGNVPVNTATATGFTVLTNDAGSAPVLAVTNATNGVATIAPDGTFSFRPALGHSGPASFTYTLSNGFGTSAPATVTLGFAAPVFFVNAAAAAGGDGRYDAPFNCLTGPTCLSASAADEAGDAVFVYSGAYTGGLTLLGTQRLIGQGVTGGSFSAVIGTVWSPDAGPQPAIGGTAPTITTTAPATNGVTLGSGNSLLGLVFGNATGSAIAGTAFGLLAVDDLTVVTTGQALNLDTGQLVGSFDRLASSGGVNNVRLRGVATPLGPATLGVAPDALSGATSDAVRIDTGTGSFTFPGSVSNTTALAVNVSGTTGGTLAFAGSLNPTTASRGIAVAGTSATTVTFSGAAQKIASTTLPGVSLTNNTGSTVRFTGGALAIATTTGAAFTATGGGTVAVTGATNTIATTGATDGGRTLNVAATTIGTGGLVFQSITSTGGGSGIVLNATGATAGLTVTGTGTTAGSGGTILTTVGDAVSLTQTASPSLRYMTLGAAAADVGETKSTVNAVAGSGIAMDGVTNAVFRNLKIARTGGNGIGGTGVNGLTVSDTQLLNVGDGDNDNALAFSATAATNLIGTVVLTNVVADGAATRALGVRNTAGTLRLTVTGGRFSNTQNLPGSATLDNIGSDGVFLSAEGTASITASVTGATFATLESDGIQGVTSGTGGAVLNLTANTNTFTGYRVGAPIPAVPAGNRSSDNALEFNATGTTTLKYTVSGNTITNTENQAILLSSNDASVVDGQITGNTIDGTASNFGIEGSTVADETASVRLLVSNNTVRNTELEAMYFVSNLTAGLNLTITNNQVPTRPRNVAATVEHIHSRALGQSNMCWNVRSNTVALGGNAPGPSAAGGIRLVRSGTNATVPRLEGAGATPLAALQANNPSSALPGFASGTIALVAANTCTLPAATPVADGPPAARSATRLDAPAPAEAFAALPAPVVAAASVAPAAAPAFTLPDAPPSASPTAPAVTRAETRTETRTETPAQGDARAASEADAALAAPVATAAEDAQQLAVEQVLAARAIGRAEAPDEGSDTAAGGPEAAARSGETVTVSVGRLAAGKTVRVLYDATLANPFPVGYDVTGRGTVTASNAPTIGLVRATPVRQTVTSARPFAGTPAPDADAGWRLLAAPVGGVTVATLAAQNLVQGVPGYYPTFGANLLTRFDGAALQPPAGGTDALGAGAGFFWYFYDRAIAPPGGPSQSVPLPFTLAATGAGTSGPVTIPLRASSANMLGNPFTLPLDVSDLSAWAVGGTLASNIAQVYDDEIQNYLPTTLTGNRVAVWEGMFVENGTATALAVPPSAQVQPGLDAPLAGKTDPLAADEAAPPTETRLVGFELRGTAAETGRTTVDRAAVLYFHTDATADWDAWDAVKLTPPAAAYALLAFEGARDGSPLLKAQESRPLGLEAPFSVGLGVDTQGTTGPLTLTWPTLGNVPDAWALSLLDVVTNATLNLRTATSYAFTASAGRTADPEALPAAGPLARPAARRFVLSVAPRATATDGPADMPAAFALAGAVPNPVRDGARIRFDVPRAATVTVEVFDVLGRLATTVVNGPVAAGRHDLAWQPTGFPSGVYLVRMRAAVDGGETFAQTRRVTIVR